MTQFLKLLLFSCFGIGSVLLLLSRKLNGSITEFQLGMLEGMSVTLIIVGVVYLSWCAIKRVHPLKISKSK